MREQRELWGLASWTRLKPANNRVSIRFGTRRTRALPGSRVQATLRRHLRLAARSSECSHAGEQKCLVLLCFYRRAEADSVEISYSKSSYSRQSRLQNPKSLLTNPPPPRLSCSRGR